MALVKFYAIACEGPHLRPELATPAQTCHGNTATAIKGGVSATAAVARKRAIGHDWRRVELQVTEYSRRRVDLCPACAQVFDARTERRLQQAARLTEQEFREGKL